MSFGSVCYAFLTLASTFIFSTDSSYGCFSEVFRLGSVLQVHTSLLAVFAVRFRPLLPLFFFRPIEIWKHKPDFLTLKRLSEQMLVLARRFRPLLPLLFFRPIEIWKHKHDFLTLKRLHEQFPAFLQKSKKKPIS